MHGNNIRFVSIKWKILASLASVVIIFMALSSWISYDRINSMFWENYTSLFSAREKEFQRIIEAEHDKLEQLVEQFILFSKYNGQTDTKKLSTQVARNWDEIQFSNSIQSLRILNNNNNVVQRFGVEFSEKFSQIQAGIVHEKQAPVFKIYCEDSCVLHSSMPIYVDENNMIIVQVSKSIEDLVYIMKLSHNMDIGVVSIERPSSSLEGKRYSERFRLNKIYSVSNGISRLQLKRLFNHIDSDGNYFDMPTKVSIEGKSWLVKFNSLPAIDDHIQLVIIGDVSSAWNNILSYRQEAVVIFLGTFLGIIIVGSLFLWSPINRLRRQTELLPLLSSGEFNHFNHAMSELKISAFFDDEIDRLKVSHIELGDQLAQFRGEIEQNTAELEKAAYFDRLTGLGNRNLLSIKLNEMLQRSRANKMELALLFVDLDDFKTINDTLGHDAGDELLILMAERLKTSLRANDFVARLGGDEFITILNISSTKFIESIVNKLVTTLSESVCLADYNVSISASIGVVIADKNDTPKDLLKKSDIAMYDTKDAGKAGFSIYRSDMSTNVAKRFEVLAEYDRAITDEEFFFVAQPQYYLDSGELRGFEILVRWKHPEKGLISPGDFIPYLEKSPHASKFGYWTIKKAVEFAVKIRKLAGKKMPVVSLNLIPVHFSDKNLPKYLNRLCRENNIDFTSIELEITENMLMTGGKVQNQIIEQIRKSGYSIAVDDFGTGYSSLSYLKKLPVDVLKIDQAFIKGMTENNIDNKIVEAVVMLAKTLNLDIIAEGIETENQQNILKQYGEIVGQGYHLSRPMDIHAALKLVEAMDLDVTSHVDQVLAG